MQRGPFRRWQATAAVWWHDHGPDNSNWRVRVQNWNPTIRGWAQRFVVASYLFGAAWSLTMLLTNRNIILLLFAFHFCWILMVMLLFAYRSTNPPLFRPLLNPWVWAGLMTLSAAVAFESLTSGFNNAAVLSGVLGTIGALAPLAFKGLTDTLRERRMKRAAAPKPTNTQPS